LELGRTDRAERNAIAVQVAALAVVTWDEAFSGDVRIGADFIVSRCLPLIGPTVSCRISFGRVPLESISAVNPQRVSITPNGGYPVLRERLQSDPGYDSVPLCFGRSSRGITLWDGHRRMATYWAAGRTDVPAWIATFKRGPGMITVGQ